MNIIDIIYFTFFSSIEYIANFFIVFSLFRLSISKYLPQVLFSCVILSYVSLSLRVGLEMEAVAPLVHLVLYFLLLWQLFSIQFIYSIIMAVVGYLVYGVIQVLLYLIYTPELTLFKMEGYILQVLTSLVAFCLVSILRKKNITFPYVINEKRRLNSTSVKTFSIMIFITSCISLIYFPFALSKGVKSLYFFALLLLVILLCTFFVLKVISKRWNQQLSQKVFYKTKRAMNAGTSIINHTIKNEISKINVLVNQLSEEAKRSFDDEQINITINQILNSTKHMNEMTVRIKEKMEDVDLIISDVHLADLIRDVVTSLQQITDDHKIKVKVIAENDIMIDGDETHIREVLINILNNSIEALKNCSNPQINIEIIEYRKFIRLSVKDNGNGIPKEIQDKVLDPFFTTKKTGNNHGLGLTYGYNIMKKHNGDLKIISVEQEGTEVVLSFPIINSKKKRVIQYMRKCKDFCV
ncbi:HAMP domain-containing sensor histidine kinase [Chengkuizengella sp. SCS-71B]|uniref:HAMP domain-containing sensor histidine kinase n=1 Tax=Chengkuizengella sp. SCS-71B TaxID=3115290 RepID=UPI0032C23C97